MAPVDRFNRLIDCERNEYSIVRMPGTGFCGFHALGYFLTGNYLSYTDVIDDCINVFANIPELFRRRTNFGGRRGSTMSLNEYASFMQHALQQVEAGKSIDEEAWAEDGHLAAVALLYDIAIFVYSTQNKQWYVLMN